MKNRYVLLADLVVFVIAVFGAFGLRFDWYFFDNRPEFVPYVLAAPPIKVLVFYLFGMYGRFWRYATVEDVVALMIANSAASVAMAAFVRRKAREADLRAANAALAAAIQARHTYSPEVQAAVERFHHTMGELQKETILHVLDMRKVLTPAQAARFDQRIAQALTEETR